MSSLSFVRVAGEASQLPFSPFEEKRQGLRKVAAKPKGEKPPSDGRSHVVNTHSAPAMSQSGDVCWKAGGHMQRTIKKEKREKLSHSLLYLDQTTNTHEANHHDSHVFTDTLIHT